MCWLTVLFAGCQSPSETSSNSVQNEREPGMSMPRETVAPREEPVPILPLPPVILVLTNPVPPPPPAEGKPSTPLRTGGWVPWEQWSRSNRWSKPERIRNSSSLAYELKNSNGRLEFTAGSRLANWNGVNLELGFAPKLANGQPMLHSLDVGKTLEPLSQSAALLRRTNRTIVIDPGHGGDNLGARSAVANRYEKEFTLDWAMRLAPLLKGLGWKVVLTRTNDVDLSLSNRVAAADACQADLFVSLHFNSTDQPQGASDNGGLETYCLTPVGMPSSLTRNFEDELHRLYPNNAFDLENYQFATRIQRALVDGTQRKDRGVRRARFMGVLRGQNRPAVLIEGGYLTYGSEAQLIASAQFRQKLADAVAKALSPEMDLSEMQTGGRGAQPGNGNPETVPAGSAPHKGL